MLGGFDYDNKIVHGQNTQFGESGSAQVGDVLRIGVRGPGVAATYYGDVVITSIASTIQASVASTASLIGPTIGNLHVAGFAGTIIPITLHRLKIDPALASGVILTTITDVFGFLSFLGLATLFLI